MSLSTAFEKNNNISVLDIGCGDGAVTFSIFDNFKEITKVIGIDKNIEVINQAMEKNTDTNKYDFRVFDIEEIDFTYVSSMLPKPKKKFDIIYCSLVLPHLEQPYQLILKIKSILSPNGIVVFRSSDDGTKICYPDSEVLKSILEYTSSIPGVSDRYNARKMLSLLQKAKFDQIVSSYDIIDTIGKNVEERKRLFHKSFSFRRNYLNKTLLKNIETNFSKDEFDSLLHKLEGDFLDPSFYYMEISYIFMAKLKKGK